MTVPVRAGPKLGAMERLTIPLIDPPTGGRTVIHGVVVATPHTVPG